jgi:hypothetical protein
MLKTLLAVTTMLGLGAGAAMAENVQVDQQTPIAPPHINICCSTEIRTRPQLATRESEYSETATIGKDATQPTGSDQEPESISRGTEP